MKFEIPKKSAGYYPEVLSILSAIDDDSLFHENKNLSHPADIFLIAFNDVIDCAHRLSTRVNSEIERRKFSSPVDIDELDDIRIDIFCLIFYTANFLEACQSIIKSLFENGGNDKEFVKSVREFGENIKPYRDHTSKIINEIKHQHRRIRPFSFTSIYGIIIGYFVEGLVEPNVIGPEPKIHPRYHELNTGISINRDIPYHLINVYFASACLSSVIKKYARFGSKSSMVLDGKHIAECFREVAKIPLIFLPDEIQKQVPSVLKTQENEFMMELPSKREPENRVQHEATVQVTARIGIRSRSIAPPYMLGSK